MVTDEPALAPPPFARAAAWVSAARPHQWAKNVLVFVPAILAHRWGDLRTLRDLVVAFVAMGLAASGTYLLNDALDAPNDRMHPAKKHRPFASGILPTPVGIAGAPLLFAAAVSLGAVVNMKVAFVIALYLALSTVYSYWTKSIAPLDALWLGALYTLRVVLGGVAAGVPVSSWLLGFSLFFFTGLAFGKRSAELVSARAAGIHDVPGRGYSLDDLHAVSSLGAALSVVAPLLLALYLQSPDVRTGWPNHRALAFCVPAVLFFVARFWLVVLRGQMHHDPVMWALRDKTSWVFASGVAVAMLVASGAAP